MKENYADVLESYLIPAQEGFGLDLLKFLGKGLAKVAAAVGLFIGIPVALAGVAVAISAANEKMYEKRYNNPTPEEKFSRDNFSQTWVSEIDKFREMIARDIDNADKKLDIKKFIHITNTKIEPCRAYCYDICSLEWEKCQYPDSDGDDEGDPKLVREFSEKISQMKPYFEKWKTEAKKFAPYFTLVLAVEEPDDDYYFCNFYVSLRCNWIDKIGILKPGLPKFGEK